MTEEQNKLAEEIERLEALQAECAPVPLVFKLGDVDWGKIAAAIRAEREPSVALILRCRNCGSTNVEDVEREPATEAVLAALDGARNEITRLMKNPREVLSEHPGCVYCMERGTPVGEGEVCPVCGDRTPTQVERENTRLLVELAALKGKGASQGDSAEDRETMRRDFERSIYEREGGDEDAKR